MVSPWVKRGSLNNYLMDNPSVDRSRLVCAHCTYMYLEETDDDEQSMQVADGLAYLHSCGVVNRLFKFEKLVLNC